MAKSTKSTKSTGSEGVYRVIDVIGGKETVVGGCGEERSTIRHRSLRDLRIAEVAKLDVKIEGGKVVAYRARLQLSFKYEP